MAYFLTHILFFNNRITEDITIELYRKDVEPDEVTELKATECQRRHPQGDGRGADAISSGELSFSFFLPIGSPYTYRDFLVSALDDWQVTFKVDGQTEFIGFLTPNEGRAAFRDLPYEINLSATDGLGLLKTAPLTKINGTQYNFEEATLLSYLLSALSKTYLTLNLRVYCSMYEESFPDRITDPTADLFKFLKQDFRTYQKNPTEFMDCYNVLLNILADGFTLYQYYGKWVLFCITELQQTDNANLYYTEYDYQGNYISSGLEDIPAALVGKNQVLHPRNANQDIAADYSIKSAKHTFKYEPWPELPYNNKFERGTVFEEGTLPDDPTKTYKKSFIDGYNYGKFIASPSQRVILPALDPATPDIAYRYSVYNQFGIEESREVIIENGSDPEHRLLIPEGLPVNQYDMAEISLDHRYSVAGTGFKNWITIFLLADSGLRYTVENNSDTNLFWQLSGGWNYIRHEWPTGDSFATWTALNAKVPAIPEKGRLFFAIVNFDSTNTETHIRNMEISYFPYIAGSLRQVDGDYWLTEQNRNFNDTTDVQVYTSDSPTKIAKGALLRNNGSLTTRSWRFPGVAGAGRDFKEIINIGSFNLANRRMWKVSGTIGGCSFYAGDTGQRYPLALHKHYFFTDAPELSDTYFRLVPPLTIDYVKGLIEANFRESRKQGEDFQELGNNHIFNYIFK